MDILITKTYMAKRQGCVGPLQKSSFQAISGWQTGVPTANTISVGDIVHAVAKEALDAFQTLVGQRSEVSITAAHPT